MQQALARSSQVVTGTQAWEIEIVDPGSLNTSFEHTSLALDLAGNPSLVYRDFDFGARLLKFARKAGP